MSSEEKGHRTSFLRRRGKILLILCALFLAILAVGLALLAHYAEPLLRAKVIETLSTRFQSRVDLDELTISGIRGLAVAGKGLRIYGPTDPNIHKEGTQPLVGVDEFRFRIGLLSLLHTPVRVGTVYMQGLELNIPPKQDRQQMSRMSPQGGKIKIVVGEFHSDRAMLVINTSRADKAPLEFDIHHLVMRNIGDGRPLQFKAILVNPKPVGDIDSKGEFGPFNVIDPSQSPVSGEYTFSNADLGTLKGIGGILSSEGRYQGTLGEIVVDGETDTPDFRLNISGRPVPLKTTFHAIVDGTTGDTFLQPVQATILNTPLTATGFVVRSTNAKGHRIKLDVSIPSGKISDLLRLAVRTDPPVMTGTVHLRTQLEIVPGDPDLADRIRLHGKFQVTSAHFSNEHIQSRVDALSMRSQGKPRQARDAIPDNVKSRMGGDFVLENSMLTLPNLLFEMPGTRVALAGDYSLDGNQFDFHGKARFDASLSQMVGGWKSIFLKPVDPFFRKNGAGTELPIKITGTKSEPHFGLDFHHKGQSSDDTTPERAQNQGK
jgi:hypothetical protein